ncbi:putative peptidoglycan binding domain protein [compost metagenome]
MAKILVYNPSTHRMEVYYRGLSEPMPYARNLTVGEFKGTSKTDVIWTDKRAMEAWNKLRTAYGKPINVGYAFSRIWEGKHGAQSQHYAGMAFDMGQRTTAAERDKIRNIASSLGVFGYVEPKALTPTWVHVDTRVGPPACPRGGYPITKQGSKGVYVAILQDALNRLGYNTGTIDGIFGANTRNAVVNFQRANGLGADGVVGCATWTRITQLI